MRLGLSPLPVHGFEPHERQWMPHAVPVAERAPPSELTVVTYNVLFARHDEAHLDTPQRMRAVLQRLQRAQADVIALQEVTPPLLAALLAEDWVREAYRASDSPAGETVTPYGQLLLSRVPLVSLAQHRFTRDKRVLVGELDTAGGRLFIAVVHMLSDLASGAEVLRPRHLGVLLDDILGPADPPDAPDWLVVGDFNFGDDGPQERFAEAQLVDLWPALHPEAPGFTFDPAHNPLAAMTSTSGRPARLDRILLRSPRGTWTAREISLFGAKDPPSDHFGLRCRLTLGRDAPL